MDFTFGIVTDGSCRDRIGTMIESIRHEVPTHEIIVVGGDPIAGTIHIPHDESAGIPMWLAYKKNRITATAKYDSIVYMHDYIALEPGWYRGFVEFGNDWLLCMTPILDITGERYRDWVLDPSAANTRDCLLPYDVIDLSYYMYFSGAYWVAKKSVMQQFPLDESLDDSVGQRGEDIIWSRSLNTNHPFTINPLSKVKLLKPNERVYGFATPEIVAHLRTHPKRPVLCLKSKEYP